MSCRASAEEAMRMLKGSQMGGNTARLSWAHLSANKQVALLLVYILVANFHGKNHMSFVC